MKKFLLLLFPVSVVAQPQLLLNGGFESENICAEYKVNCAPEAWIYTIPSYIHYFKEPSAAHSGTHYVALIAGHEKKPFTRSFVRSKLVCGLKNGAQYRLSLWVKSEHAILDSLGIYFTQHDFLYERRPYQTISPTIYLKNFAQPPGNLVRDWQEVTTTFTATGDEVFISVGNFRRNGLGGATGIDKEANFFFLLDDISLTPLNPMERLCPNYKQAEREIIAQTERHEYQARLMKQYRITTPPQPLPLLKTVSLQIDTLIVPDVLFNTGSFVLNRSSFAMLDSFAKHLAQKLVDSVIVAGHTDAIGTESDNQTLSWRRAGTVAAYVEQKSNKPCKAYGWGSSRPVATNSTSRGRQRNRRVEILVYTHRNN